MSFKIVQSNCPKKLLKNIELNKTADTDNISGRFLNDGANILATPITQLFIIYYTM